jgi:hypothetical protein
LATTREIVNNLERVDYQRYLRQVAEMPKNVKAEIFKDWRLYRAAFCWVVETLPDSTVRAVRFVPRSWQLEYEETRTLNDIALKGRKIGFSTDILTEMYAKAATLQHQRAALMSHEDEATKRLLEILRIVHEYNPMAPPLDKNNTKEMVFQYTKSRIWVGTAGARVFGRGDDLTLLHLSEAAHFFKRVDDVETFMAGVSEAVAKGGRFVLESTPNGEDPIFFQRWQAAISGELWTGLFLSIFQDDTANWDADHPLALPSTKRKEFDLTEYEQVIMQSMGGKLGHIRFLRYEKEKMASISPSEPTNSAVVGDERVLLQEYPVDDQTCFLSGEDLVFDTFVINLLRQRAKGPMFSEGGGALNTYEKPINDHAYVLFLDTSEGLPSSHFQAAAVLDVTNMKYVAHLRIKTNLIELAKMTVRLAEEYNTALLMVERNNHGHAVLQTIDQMGYPNIYFHQEGDNFLRRGESRMGYPTRGTDTKPLMVSEFKEYLEAGALDIQDPAVLREAAAYRYEDSRSAHRRGKAGYGPPSGGTDDSLMAAMGALQGRRFATAASRKAPVTSYGSFNKLAAALGARPPLGK